VGDHAESVETFRKDDPRRLDRPAGARDQSLADRRGTPADASAHHPQSEKRERIARASMELRLPFAQRLGRMTTSGNGEDLASPHFLPEAHGPVAELAREASGKELPLGI